MTETLIFPGLGLELNLNRVAFKVGNFAIYWYGVIIASAFLLAALYLFRRHKAFGLDGDRIMDVVLGSTLVAIVGARLYYVIFSWDYYKDNLSAVFSIRQGGLAIYGAIIGAFLMGILMCRWRKVALLPMFDLAVGCLLLGQGIGRWANFVNIEAFGSNTTLPWGMTSDSIAHYLSANQAQLAALGVHVDPAIPVHPTFLYESLWCLLGFLVIALWTNHRRFDGELTLIYFAWYGFGRFFIEGLRTDSLLLGNIRISQIVAILCFLASVIALVVIRSKIRREADPEYLKLYVNTEEGQQVLAGTFYEKKTKAKATTEENVEKVETADSDPGEQAQDNTLPEDVKDSEISLSDDTSEDDGNTDKDS